MRHLQRQQTTMMLTVALLLTLDVSLAVAAPQPAMAPADDVWQLDIEFRGQPRMIMVRLPGDMKVKRFWYLPYTITNNTGDDVTFYPRFELLTNTLKLSSAGVGVRRAVFEQIRQQYDTTLPLMEHEDLITGKVLVGADHARDSVAIFEDFDPTATSVSLFVTGLSSEAVSVDHPVKVDDDGAPIKIRLHKTLKLQYHTPGDEFNPQQRVMHYRQRDWIMR